MPPPTSTDMNVLVRDAAAASPIPAHPLPQPRWAIAAHVALSYIDGGRGDCVGSGQLPLPPPTSTDMNRLVRDAAAASPIPAHPLPPPRLTIAAPSALSDVDGGCGDGVGGAQLPLPPPTSTDVGGRVTESAAPPAIPAHLHPPPRLIIAARAALSDTRRRPRRWRRRRSVASAAVDVDRRGRAHDRRSRHVPHLRLTASFPSGKHRRTCGVVFQPRRPRPEVGTTRRQRRPASGRTSPRRLPQTPARSAARRPRGRCPARTGPYL